MHVDAYDFRRLLTTPQPIKKTSNKFKPSKRDNSFLKNENSKSKPKKRWKKLINEEEDMHYRDRAKERRQEMNPDYEETKAIFSMLNKNSETEINEKTLTYEQSKYLGGDESHTHLVKGLDYAFLQKVRKELEMKKIQKQKDDEAKEYVEQIHGDNKKPTFNSVISKNIHYWAVEKPKEQLPLKNEMFIAGRMAYVWELGLENGYYVGSSDIPITLQRSKAEIKNYQDKFNVSTNDLVIDKISQIMVNVRLGIRNIQNSSVQEKKKIKKKEKEKTKKMKKLEKISNPPEDYEDIFDDVGIDYKLNFDKKDSENKKENLIVKNYFGSTENNEDKSDENNINNINNNELFKGSKLLEKLMSNKYDNKIMKSVDNNKNNFEMNIDNSNNNTNDKNDNNKLNLWQSDKNVGPSRPSEFNESEQLNTWQSNIDIGPSRPPEFNESEQLNTWQSNIDIGPSRPPEFNESEQLNTWQSNIDIGPSRPPEFNESEQLNTWQSNIDTKPSKLSNYNLDNDNIKSQDYENYKNNLNVPNKIKPLSKEQDNELDYSDSSDSEDDDGYSQMDLGTNRNKQRQLKRWDFDTEEEWKQYKDNSVIIPKAAFQYGVKSSEGRQKSAQHKASSKSQDEKLSRELKQIEKIMNNKYKKSGIEEQKIDPNDDNNSHASSRHSNNKRHSKSRWEDDDDYDKHNKRNRH
ncbi:hypothetical protein BCR36DRAFT_584578 [Piromyces finnis]|uniref:RED-like N-terminal domain-containing protein n=1 Tax=Piromyces finnis TaxID=1754191 RepID=A0A1Y1V6U5_9FUNG|nr:hypothetical protein BCR36DRAFT_584578 [Piromyces finnis]|eukprot:ORX47874.1 hypothetical protein BCR36DRAFT_584578 [Piromyces finnis]